MKFTIYIATNRENGKRYVGLTGESLHARKLRHFNQARNGRKARFAAAIRKYGEGSFDWAELCRAATLEDAKAKEIELIAALRPEYNVTAGGDGALGMAAWNRQPVMCLNDGRIFPTNAAATAHYKIGGTGEVSRSCDNKTAPRGLHFVRYSAPLSEVERTALIRQRALARSFARRRTHRVPTPETSPPVRSNARRVICLDDGAEFGSASAAAAAYGLAKSGVIEVCLGAQTRKKKTGGLQRRFTAGGLRFAYAGAP
jgi:hypothetical protein